MDWSKLENIASGKNTDGSRMHHKGYLSGIIDKIKQGKINIVEITSSIASVLLWSKLFTPEYVINQEYLESNPDVAEAINLAAPNVDLDSVEFDTPEEMMGFINLTKGKLFELKVADKLNSGERVGDFQLEPGQTVQLAESPIQEGHDLEVVNADGTIEDLFQCKATDSLSYVKSALEENPDIPVITTSEVSESIDDIDILDSGIDNSSFENLFENLVTEEFWSDFPGVAECFALVAIGKEFGGVIKGKQSFKSGVKGSLSYFLNRTVASAGGSVAAACALAIGCGPIAVAGVGIVGAIAAGKYFKNHKSKIVKYFKRSFSPFTGMFSSLSDTALVYRALMLKRYGLKNSEDLLTSPDLLQEFFSKRKLSYIELPSVTTVIGISTAVAGGVVVGKALLSIAGSLLGASLDFL